MIIETNLNNFFVFQAQEFGFGGNSKDFILTANNIFRQLYRRCFCGSDKVVHNGYKSDKRIIIEELGLVIKRGQCSCRACGATWIIRPEEVDVWIKQLKQIINNEIISLVANKLSFEKTAEHIKNIYGKDISIEWIRQLYNRAIKKLRARKPKDISGYFNYDEQHIKENGEEVVRITIIDAIKKDVVLDKKFKNKGKKTVTRAIKSALKKYEDKIKCFIVDMDRQYPFILEELYGKEVKIQWCVFHLFKHINKEFREGCGYGKAKRKLSLMNEYNKMSLFNIFFNHDKELLFLRKLMKRLEQRKTLLEKASLSKKEKENLVLEYEDELRKEYGEYCRTLKKNRRRKGFAKLKRRTYKKAEELLEQIKAMIDLYPKKLVNRIRKIIEHWDKFSLGLRDRKVPLTNNNIEQYYSATLHQVEKRRFRSEEAIETRLKVSVLKNNKRKLFSRVNFIEFLQLTSKISFIFSPE